MTPYDGSPTEIESRAELDLHLTTGNLAGLTVQGLRLDLDPPDLTAADLTDTYFIGCRFASLDAEADLVRRGAHGEDTILRLARGGIVFAPGRAGTVQEVFQAATKTFYATDGDSGPYVFLDKTFWTDVQPVEVLLRPLLAQSPHGDLSGLIHLTDDVDEAAALLTAGGTAF